jgi:hypothetical protein
MPATSDTEEAEISRIVVLSLTQAKIVETPPPSQQSGHGDADCYNLSYVGDMGRRIAVPGCPGQKCGTLSKNN